MMFLISAFDKAAGWLVEEHELANVDWPEIRRILDIQEEYPMGDYPLNEAQFAKLKTLANELVGEFDKSRNHYVGEYEG